MLHIIMLGLFILSSMRCQTTLLCPPTFFLGNTLKPIEAIMIMTKRIQSVESHVVDITLTVLREESLLNQIHRRRIGSWDVKIHTRHATGIGRAHKTYL